jgi:RNA polymerase sigma-70 factor (ECF subfamily)
MHASAGVRSTLVDPDAQLVESSRKGDEKARKALYARHFAGIHSFFEHKVSDHDADELAQRTMIKAFSSLDTFQGRSTFRTYLFVIARNELNQWLRDEKKKQNAQVDLDQSSLDELVSSPSKQYAREEEKQRLRAALRRLPVEQQTLLEMHYWYGIAAADLAVMFETNANNILQRLHRARKKLRELMTETHPLDPTSVDPLASSLQSPDLDQPVIRI